MKRREGCGAVSPLASYLLRLNRAFEQAVVSCTPFVPFVFLWQIAFALLGQARGPVPTVEGAGDAKDTAEWER